MRRSLATAHGGAQSAPAARLGSERSRPAGHRRQTRLEAQAQGTAAIQAWLGPKLTPTFGVETVENLGCRTAGAWAAARPGDFTTLGPGVGSLERGTCGESSERARTSAVGSPFARSSWWRDAGRMGRRASRKLTARPWCSGCATETIEAGPGGPSFLRTSGPPGVEAVPGPPGLH
jgi:hypothetical protein